MKKQCGFCVTAMLVVNLAFADGYRAGDLLIDHAHVRPTVPGQTSGAAYINIENKGTIGDKLLTVSSPVAKSAEVHIMVMDGNIMRMRQVSELALKPSATVTMAPGDGYHIMLVNLSRALKPGEKIPLTLRFEKAGKIDIEAQVDDK